MPMSSSLLSVTQSNALNALSSNQLTALVNALPIFEGTWANLLSGFPANANAGKRAVVTDFGNMQVRSDGSLWRLQGPTFLSHTTTPVVGVASASAQILMVSTALPRSLFEVCRYIAATFHLSKSGATDAVTTTLFIGPNGNNTDSSMYSTAAFTAGLRQFSGGHLYVYHPTSARLRNFTASQNFALEASATNTSAHPVTQSANMANVNQFVSLYVTVGGTTDIPTAERLTVVGY